MRVLDALRGSPRFGWLLGGCALLATVAVPFVLTAYHVSFLLNIFVYIGLAYSWNLISGYTGYISFGHVVFFGVGAYTTALLLSNQLVPVPLALLAAGVISLVISIPLGWLLLRLRGAYFAMGMLAVAEVARLAATSWRSLTNGGSGIYVSMTYNLVPAYYGLLLLLVAIMLLTRWVDNSRFGLRLLSIREDEDAAEMFGINTTWEKLKAFVLSATFPGLIGGLSAWYIGFINPQSAFHINYTLYMVVMVLFGGAGTFAGPLVGGIVYGFVVESLWARFPEYNTLATGVFVVLVMLLLPKGVTDLLRRARVLPARRRLAVRLGGHGDRPSSGDAQQHPAGLAGAGAKPARQRR